MSTAYNQSGLLGSPLSHPQRRSITSTPTPGRASLHQTLARVDLGGVLSAVSWRCHALGRITEVHLAGAGQRQGLQAGEPQGGTTSPHEQINKCKTNKQTLKCI